MKRGLPGGIFIGNAAGVKTRVLAVVGRPYDEDTHHTSFLYNLREEGPGVRGHVGGTRVLGEGPACGRDPEEAGGTPCERTDRPDTKYYIITCVYCKTNRSS